jgi:hypothetical protein
LVQQTYAQLRDAVETRSQAAVAHAIHVFHTLALLTPQLTQLCADWLAALQQRLHTAATQRPPPNVWQILSQLLEQIGAQHEALCVLHLVLTQLPHPERADRLLIADLLPASSPLTISSSSVSPTRASSAPSAWFRHTLTHPWWSAVLTLLQNELTRRTSSEGDALVNAFETLSSEYPRLVRQVMTCLRRWSGGGENDGNNTADDVATALLSGDEVKGLLRVFNACETEYFKRVAARLQEPIEALCVHAEKLRTSATETVRNAEATESEPSVPPVPEVHTVLTRLREEVEHVVAEFHSVGVFTTVTSAPAPMTLTSFPTVVNSLLLPRLIKSVASPLRLLLLKIDKLIATELSAYYVPETETSSSSPSQSPPLLLVHNIRLFNTLHVLQHGVRDIANHLQEVEGSDLLLEILHIAEGLSCQILEPLFSRMAKLCERTLTGALQTDYNSSSPFDRTESMPCSPYIKLLKRQILTFRAGIVSKFTSQSPLVLAQCQALARRIVVLFLRFAAMVRPLNESNDQIAKAKLVNDMAHLELALSPLLGSNLSQLGDTYKMLRAFKTLLFTETQLILSSPELTVLPPTLIAHHLFSRAPSELLLPYKILGWTMQQYSEYLDTHTERDVWHHALAKALESYQQFINKNGIKQFPEVYPVLLALGERIEKEERGRDAPS